MNKKNLPVIVLVLTLVAATALAAEFYVTNKPTSTTVPQTVEEKSVNPPQEPETSSLPPVVETGWVWKSQGCGSSSACSYQVCSASDSSNCYTCIGRYDKSAAAGEKLPEQNENPLTTTNFTCKQS
ncbi:MAG: hypothetical protein KW802_03455 [Candidatus Doudnabacteria bacterium]|nr:hypothetical protein [Candidatus Doudnabacteria bacterium]